MIEKSLNDPKVSLNEIVTLASEKQHQPLTNKLLSLNEIQNQKIMSSGAGAGIKNNQSTTILNNNLENLAISNDSNLFNSLNSLEVKLESIKPSSIQPVNLYDKNNLKIVLHFGRDNPLPNIHVVVLSVSSSNTNNSLKNFSFQAAVPKTMKVKLQSASRTDLPPFNPILPPTAITQIMLIANPNRVSYFIDFKDLVSLY
jgi:hypothetical protein